MHVPFRWNEEKNKQLLKERGVCFEDVVRAIACGGLLDEHPHPNQAKYPGQYLMILSIKGYPHTVPFVVDTERGHIFLKTVYKDRKLKKKYG